MGLAAGVSSGSSTTLVYLVLGTPGAGRRAIVADLIANGLDAGERALVLLAEAEADGADGRPFPELPAAEVRRWRWQAPGFPQMTLAGHACVFLLADPAVAPVDQVEALKPWLAAHDAALGRVFCVVDCAFAERTPALRGWFDACIHFADVVFLTRREGVANKWLSDFTGSYSDQFYPCHFIPVKKTGIANPALILDPQPRRVSHYFDESEDLSDVEIETDDEEDEGDGDDQPEIDPYLARMRGGRRVREVPDLRDHLPAA